MSERTPAEVFPVGHFIREELEERGWTQSDLAERLGVSRSHVSDVIAGRRGVSIELAHRLGEAFGTSAHIWLHLQVAYRLSQPRKRGRMRR